MAKEIHFELRKVEKEIGISEIEPIEEEIKKFCEIIDDNNPVYFDRSIFPPGYIMNLTNRVIQEVFIKIGPKFISEIRGVIHVSSEVKFFKVMKMNQNYIITIETSQPIEKEGKMGNYFSIVFKTSILNKENEICAIDNHEFFFKL
ncbi:MAG: hypothetical protein ACFFBP_20415 [Promethearchaeota archaeon]